MLVTERDTQGHMRESGVADFTPQKTSNVKDGWDRFNEAWQSSRFESLSVSRSNALREQYGSYLDHIEEVTGERLNNPEGMGRERLIPSPIELAADPLSNVMFGHDWTGSQHMEYDARVSEFEARVSELKKKHPGLKVRSRDDFMASIAKKAKTLRDARAEGVDVGHAGAGALAGDVAALATDPVNLASMLFGGAGAVRGATTTLSARLAAMGRTAAIEGGIGGVSEAAIQPRVFDFKADINSPYSVGDALENIAMATAGGAFLGGVVEGFGQGFDGVLARWRKSGLPHDTDTRAAERVLEAHQAGMDANPLPDGVEFDITHARAMDEATAAAVYGTPYEGRALNELRTNQAARIREFSERVIDPERPRPANRQKGKLDALWHSRTPVGRAEDLNKAIKDGADTSVDLTHAVHKLDEDGVRHALNTHRADTIPLRPGDLELVPDVIRVGEIVKADIGPTGRIGVEYRALVDGDWLHVHEDVQKKVLTFTTAYRKAGPKTKPEPKGPGSSAGGRVDQGPSVSRVIDADEGIVARLADASNEPAAVHQTIGDGLEEQAQERLSAKPVKPHAKAGPVGDAEQTINTAIEAGPDLDQMMFTELDRTITERGDFEVPVESIEVDGEVVARARSARELMDEADADIEAANAFQACIMGRG